MPPTGPVALGHYRLINRIASGTAGTVYAAVDERTGADVIVKAFDGQEDGHGTWVDEMRLAVRLDHPSIARCMDVGWDEGMRLWTLVFRRAMGGSLRRAMVAKYAFSDEDVRRILHDVALALEYAHSMQVVHRDVKPENILAADATGKPPWLLTDFGVGRFLGAGVRSRTIVGSAGYMAPELRRGRLSELVDQFSLGVVGAELLTGAPPDEPRRAAFVAAHRRAADLRGVVARMCEADPERRFPTSRAMVQALREGRRADEPLDVVRDARGRAFVLDGDLVFEPDGRAVRVARARGFAALDGDAVPYVASERRVTAVLDGRAMVRFASDDPIEYLAVDDERVCVWGVREGRVVVWNDRAGAAEEVGDFPAAVVERGARPWAAVAETGAYVVGAPRDDRVILADRRGVEVVPLPATLSRMERAAGRLVLICGDADHTRVVGFDGGRLVPRQRLGVSPDGLRIEADGDELTAVPLLTG